MIKNLLNVVLIGVLAIAIAFIYDAHIWEDEIISSTSNNLKPSSSDTNIKSEKLNQVKTNEIVEGETKNTNPSFDVVRVDSDGNAVIAGRAEPGETVSILENGHKIAEIEANKQGEWVSVAKTNMQPGTIKLTLESGKDGKKLKKSDRPVVLLRPNKEASANDVQTNKPSLLALKIQENDLPSQILQKPGLENDKNDLTIETIDYDEKGRLIITGKAPKESPVLAYLDNYFIGKTLSKLNNTWQLKPDNLVEPGIYKLRIDQLDKDYKVVKRISTPFTRSKPETDNNQQPFIIVQHGNSLWRLAAANYGSGFRYTLILNANRNLIKNPDLIYPGQIFKLPAND